MCNTNGNGVAPLTIGQPLTTGSYFPPSGACPGCGYCRCCGRYVGAPTQPMMPTITWDTTATAPPGTYVTTTAVR